jgi:hypothetical protein
MRDLRVNFNCKFLCNNLQLKILRSKIMDNGKNIKMIKYINV